MKGIRIGSVGLKLAKSTQGTKVLLIGTKNTPYMIWWGGFKQLNLKERL